MDLHLETIGTLDSLLVLGGEGEDRSRSNHAYCAHSLVSPRDCPLYIVLSGSHSGLSKSNSIDSEAEAMRKYLRFLGVPNEDLAIETKAQDTLGSMIFSRPILDDLLSGYTSRKIGLITDESHMSRSLWTAKRVWGERFSVYPLPVEKSAHFLSEVQGIAVKCALQFDLAREGITSGDQLAFETYMKEKHPFHAPVAPWGAYKLGIAFLKLIK